VRHDVAAQILSVAAGGGAEGNGWEIEPLILSMICFQLNERRRAGSLQEITAALVANEGGRILSQFYERSIADVDPRARAFLEDNLISEAGHRNTLVAEDLLRIQGITPATLQTLIDRRLLRMEQRRGVSRVELTHDVLTGVMRASRDRRRAEQRSKPWKAQTTRFARRVEKVRLRWALITVMAFLVGAAAAAAWLLSR